MDKEYFVCTKCSYFSAKEFFGNRPENWAEEYCQDCGSPMIVVYDVELIKSIDKLLYTTKSR